MQVQVSDSAEQLAQDACQWLVERICERQQTAGAMFTLALSGGSTPKRLYQLLAEPDVASKIDWNRLVLIWGDERNVAPDHHDSNFKMVADNLLSKVNMPEQNILGVPNPGGNAKQAAQEYEQLLRERFEAPSGFPRIDCVLLGMGDDVHTASLFPETDALSETERWAVPNWVEKLDCWRITLTAPFINQAHCVAFLVGGEKKTEALRSMWYGPKDTQKYPSQLIQPVGELWFMLDTAAAGDLTPP